MNVVGVIIGTLGTVVVAAFSYLGIRATVAQSRRAADTTTAVNAESQELTAWRELAGEYRSRLEVLEGRQDAAAAALREEREQRETVARELNDERERINALTSRLRAAVAYIGSLLHLLDAHEIDAPARPEALDLDFDLP